MSSQKSLAKKHLAAPKKMLAFLFSDKAGFSSFVFFLSFYKGLLQVVLSFTKVKPERQVWSVTREQPQRAVVYS